jgi:uncharacterized protein YaiI (UPF0178 family)
MLNIYIDADACTVKSEVFKVAKRYDLMVFVVANQYLDIPLDEKIRMTVVSGAFDAADDWIVTNIESGDILVTSDLLLADRCIKKEARVVSQKGDELDEDNIGGALATRELMSHLRNMGETNTGPRAMTKGNRSQFLSKLDQIIHSIRKT